MKRIKEKVQGNLKKKDGDTMRNNMFSRDRAVKSDSGPCPGLKTKRTALSFGLFSSAGPFGFMSLAFAAVFIGHHQMYFSKQTAPALVMYGIAAFFVIAAHLASKDREEKINVGIKTEALLFALVLAAAFFFRFYMIDSVPTGLFSDEARNGVRALELMKGEKIEGAKLPVFLGTEASSNAAMYIYFIAVFLKFFGPEPENIRMTSAFLGALSVPAFYFFLRYVFGSFAAVLGGFLFAGMSWHVIFSRIGFHAVFAVLLLVLVLYFLFRAYKERTWQDFIMLGAVLALSQYTYIPARAVPLLPLILIVYLAAAERSFFKDNFKKMTVCAGVALVIFLPMLGYIIKHPDRYTGRPQGVSILNEDLVEKFYHGRYTVKERLKENIKEHLLMFGRYGDGNARHNKPGAPMLDYITGALAVLGLVYLLLRLFSPLGIVMISGFILFILPGVLTIEAPQALRTILLTPLAVVFAVVPLKKMIDYSGMQFGKKGKTAVSAAALMLVIAAGAMNYDKYFNQYGKSPQLCFAFHTQMREAAEYMEELDGSWHVIAEKALINSEAWDYLGKAIKFDHYSEFDYSGSIPIDLPYKRGYIYLLPVSHMPLVDVFEDLYPNGTYEPFINEHDPGHIYYFAYKVPYEDYKRRINEKGSFGLSAEYYSDENFSPPPVFERVDPLLHFQWHVTPVSGRFSAEWTGTIMIPRTGRYFFEITSNDFSEVYINGKLVCRENETPKGENYMDLKKGEYDIKARYSSSVTYSRVSLKWKGPSDEEYKVVPAGNLKPDQKKGCGCGGS
ncbi:MAG: PA14 domain-containing protein [Candidatus Goldiibacteriota bacterium]